jgi:beta-xylosidase
MSIVVDNVLQRYSPRVDPTPRVTIRDVAAQAGVSVATVSKVINSRYGVAADTVARVQAVIDELGYEASLVAQSLRNHRTNVIGILVADLEPFSAELLKGAADAIRGSGYEMVVYSAGGHARGRVGWERRYLSRLSGTLIDGAVLVTPTVIDVNYGAPIVAIDPHTGPSGLPTIDSDNLRGGQLATSHLLELGHRRIAMLSGRPDLQSAALREEGYRRALAAAGVALDDDLVRVGDYDPEVSAAQARELLTSAHPPTAIFAANDMSAIAAIGAAAGLGLSVPGELSVVGFDNIPESALCTPALTTVIQPIRQMGEQAIRLLLQLIRGELPAATHLTLATDLVIRQSTAAPVPHRMTRAAEPRPVSIDHSVPAGTAVPATTPGSAGTFAQGWRDPAAGPAERVRDLLGRMTLREKVAQLYGVWVGVDAAAGAVVPHQHDFAGPPADWAGLAASGVGQLTRVFGTAPVDPAEGARALARIQREVITASRLGIPAIAHEECLAGLLAWQATGYPAPLSWGASFDPGLVERMGAQIGGLMRRLGVHQGLAPVLDVARDLRWGRVEETIGEDPWLVGTIGSAYVRGLESAGVVATLKHFAGYSGSRAGRNLAPVPIGPRELADVLLPPFEMALRAGARSVMNSYADLDGVPAAADPGLLTRLLREDWGFAGTVVSDYFSVAFLHTLHGVAGSRAEAAALALAAGIDTELPAADCYGEPLLQAVESGLVDEKLVDRAAARVLTQKCELGLLDANWTPGPDPEPAPGTGIDLDDDQSRALARELARRSVVLLRNEAALPLAAGLRLAVVGPCADEPTAVFGCYSFPVHVGAHHPDLPVGIEVATVAGALRADPAGYQVSGAPGCPVTGGDDAGIAAAARLAADADVCVAVLGDRAGMFGAGTSGEGCDAESLRLPGRQEELLDALLATGTPVVLVLLAGRPYELSRQAGRLAAAVCGFFPGEEGAGALADVLSGRVSPSGRLPVSFPGPGASQPSTYLSAPLGQRSQVSTVDPTPLYAFGHGLSYAPATWAGARLASGREWPTGGSCELEVSLRNDAAIATTEVVQVYLHDPVAEVARPVQQLIAARRVDLAPGQARTVRFGLHADLTSYTGRAGDRQVDPGQVELRVGASSADIRATLELTLTGPRRTVGFSRVLHPEITVSAAE